jgi:hypothetical protein
MSGRYRFSGVLRSEWTKFLALRSTRWTLAAFPVIAVGLGILIGALSGSGWASLPAEAKASWDPTNNLLAALIPGYLLIPVLGVLAMTSEYGSGLVRVTFAAVPRRGWVLLAKALVLAGVTVAVCEVVTFLAFLAGRAAMGGGAPRPGFGDPGVLRALTLSGAYLALLGVFGLGLGAVIRRSGAAVAAYSGVVLLLPTLVAAVSVHAATWGPMIILANSISAARVDRTLFLSPLAGFLAMAAYAGVALSAALLLLARRDA